jgi:hypothetical protein
LPAGRAEQVLDCPVSGRVEPRPADAPPQSAPQLAWLLGNDPIETLQGLVEVGLRPGHQHDELVSAQSGHDVGGAEAAEQQLGEMPQQGVAGGMAEAVVDRLEFVEVEKHQLGFGAGPAAQLEDVTGDVVEPATIGDLGQLVDGGP